jgi:hypothetical protein
MMNIMILRGRVKKMQIKPVIAVNERCLTVEAIIQLSIHLQQNDEVMLICCHEFRLRTRLGNILQMEMSILSPNHVLGHVRMASFLDMYKCHSQQEVHLLVVVQVIQRVFLQIYKSESDSSRNIFYRMKYSLIVDSMGDYFSKNPFHISKYLNRKPRNHTNFAI